MKKLYTLATLSLLAILASCSSIDIVGKEYLPKKKVIVRAEPGLIKGDYKAKADAKAKSFCDGGKVVLEKEKDYYKDNNIGYTNKGGILMTSKQKYDYTEYTYICE